MKFAGLHKALIYVYVMLISSYSVAAEGMPQFNAKSFNSQLFWLAVTFGLLYILVTYLILPRIRDNIRLRKNKITIRPIAGTRPRGSNAKKDALYKQELLNDKKELSEHLMLLDLICLLLVPHFFLLLMQVPNTLHQESIKKLSLLEQIKCHQ